MKLWIPLLLATAAWAQTGRLTLNGTWQFALAHDDREAGSLSRFFEPDFDRQSFRPIPVPSNWALHGFEEPMYGRLKSAGEGFYYTRFEVPAEMSGRRVMLHFDGVWSSAEVWLNAQPLGRHDSGFTGFAFDVTPYLHAGAENALAVRVRQLTRDYLFDTNDDWSLGGIFRDVWLETMPRDRYLDRVESSVHFDSQYRDADLGIRALVMQGRAPGAGDYVLRFTLAGPEGRTVESTEMAVASHPNTGRDTMLDLHVRAPLQWTVETPALYQLRVELLESGRVVQERSHAVGFREVSTRGGVLRLNGRPIKLRGVCRHDEHPDTGIATGPEQWLQDIRLMKAANINAVRDVHYPPAAGFLDLCDRMGLYVIDESPMGYGGDLGSDPSYISSALLRAWETVVRDRNHPSVIIWSVGNENPLTPMHLATMRAIKGWDPTRPLLLPWHAEAWMPPEVDILAPHYPGSLQAEALTASATRPVVATEYTHALGEQGFGGLADAWTALSSHPAGAGGTIWMWQDQGLRVNGKMLLNREGIDGIVRADRTPQRDYWETRAVYAPVSVAVDSVSFRVGQAAVPIPIRNDYDFTDLSAVAVRWRVAAGERELASAEARLSAPPHTTAVLQLPVDSIRAAGPVADCYAQFTFVAPDGSEITRAGVALHPAGAVPEPPAPGGKLTVRRGRTLTVSAAGAVYEFDPATASLVSVSYRGRRVVTGAHLTLWRAPHEDEAAIYRRAGFEHFPDLDRFSTAVTKWQVEQTGGAVRITAAASHQVDASDGFAADYEYRVLPDGSLHMNYSVKPKVTAPWIPEFGVELQTAPEYQSLRWVGLGPYEAYPNLKAAPIFGQWATDAAGVRNVIWAELRDGSESGMRVEDCSWIRFAGSGMLRALGGVEGRPSKYRRPDRPEYRIDLQPSTVLRGALTLRPAGNR